MSFTKLTATVATWAIIIIALAISVFPFIWMITTAFKTLREAHSSTFNLLPEHWQWRNFVETFQTAPFGRYFFNTFYVACCVTASVVLTSLAAGYAFARLDFPGRNFFFALFLATMMVPFEIVLIPNFVLIEKLGWYNTYAAMIVPWCANAFSIFLVRQAFMALPRDYFDCARIDGCGHLRFLAWVGAPMVKPILVTVGLFAFLGCYNALLWPLVVTSSDSMRVIQVALTDFVTAQAARINLLMCATTIVITPTVIVYFIAQKHFMQADIRAGIKG